MTGAVEMPKTSKVTVFLRCDYNKSARTHIEDYLNAEYPDHGKVTADLLALADQAEKIVVSKYDGQHQVSAFFVGYKDGQSYGVSGLGDTLDLAVLSCYVKCALVFEWKFGEDTEGDVAGVKPRFS